MRSYSAEQLSVTVLPSSTEALLGSITQLKFELASARVTDEPDGKKDNVRNQKDLLVQRTVKTRPEPTLFVSVIGVLTSHGVLRYLSENAFKEGKAVAYCLSQNEEFDCDKNNCNSLHVHKIIIISKTVIR